MTALPGAWLPALLAAVLAASPLLTSWTVTLETGAPWRWWQPRNVTPTRWMIVAAVAALLTLGAAAGGAPWLAWTAFAVGGAVLLTVDAITHCLPARFVYPLASVIGFVLLFTAAFTGATAALLRAAVAAGVVALVWLAVVLLIPAAIGLGDVRLFSLSAALLGWLGWPAVLVGQLLTFVLAPIAVLSSGVSTSGPRATVSDRGVPMGPSAVAATIIAACVLHT